MGVIFHTQLFLTRKDSLSYNSIACAASFMHNSKTSHLKQINKCGILFMMIFKFLCSSEI